MPLRPFYILILLVFLTACHTTASLPAFKRTVKVTFISFPAGGVIEIDGEYKGRTPNVIELKEYHMEHEGNVPPYKVFIYPTQEESYCTKKAALNPYDLPAEISFDLTQCQGEPDNP